VVERILAVQAVPRPALDALQAESRQQLCRIGGPSVPPRSMAEYQKLLPAEETHPDEGNHQEESHDADDDA
jgi:hypothetical protein